MDGDPATSDLGLEQRRRIRADEITGEDSSLEERPEDHLETDEPLDDERQLEELEESGSVERLDEVDKELAEDLRRAQPNPPLTVTIAGDPNSDVDLGYLEDPDARSDDNEQGQVPVELETVDPLYAEREEHDRPGRSEDTPPD